MDSEYGAMDASGSTFVSPRFALESGEHLREATVRYNTYGTMNASGTNAVVVCHALTGNSALHTWWSGLLGPGLPLDTDKDCCEQPIGGYMKSHRYMVKAISRSAARHASG